MEPMTPIEAKLYLQRKKQRVDVALTLFISYKEWKESTLQGIDVERAVELTNELFDGVDKGN